MDPLLQMLLHLLNYRNKNPRLVAMGPAAQQVFNVIDNSNTPYGQRSLAHGYRPGLGDDPSDRAARDFINQLRQAQ